MLCKTCQARADAQKEYRKRNADRIRERNRIANQRYRKRHPERVKESLRRHREKKRLELDKDND